MKMKTKLMMTMLGLTMLLMVSCDDDEATRNMYGEVPIYNVSAITGTSASHEIHFYLDHPVVIDWITEQNLTIYKVVDSVNDESDESKFSFTVMTRASEPFIGFIDSVEMVKRKYVVFYDKNIESGTMDLTVDTYRMGKDTTNTTQTFNYSVNVATDTVRRQLR